MRQEDVCLILMYMFGTVIGFGLFFGGLMVTIMPRHPKVLLGIVMIVFGVITFIFSCYKLVKIAN